MKIPVPTGQIIEHEYVGTPFSIEAHELNYGGDCWTTWQVEVYRRVAVEGLGVQTTMIGEYERRYNGFVKTTFHPFEINSEWYALYSANYTCTRVAKLTENKFIDWCGEESDSHGFCPVDYYVPRYHEFVGTLPDGRTFTYEMFDNECEPEDFMKQKESGKCVGTAYLPYGFLSGCVWGDDSSWKLRFIDLSKVPEKELLIDERFGYWELPDSPLRDCIDIEEAEAPWIKITGSRAFHLKKQEFE